MFVSKIFYVSNKYGLKYVFLREGFGLAWKRSFLIFYDLHVQLLL